MIENGNFQSIFGLNADEFFNSFNKSGSESISTLTQFCGKFKEMDDTMRSYLTDCMQKQVPASFDGYNKYVQSAINNNKQLTLSAKAGQVALKGLAIAGTMLAGMAISFAISKAIEGIDYLIHREERLEEAFNNAKESAQSFRDEMKNIQKESAETASSANKIADSYAKLVQGVNPYTNENVSLSNEQYEEFLNLNEQLADLFPSLTQNYDENGNAILGLGGSIETVTGKIAALVEQQERLAKADLKKNLENYVNGDDENGGQLDVISGYADKLEKEKDKVKDFKKELKTILNGGTDDQDYLNQKSLNKAKKYYKDKFGLTDEELKQATSIETNFLGEGIYRLDFSKLEIDEDRKTQILNSYNTFLKELEGNVQTTQAELDNANQEMSDQMMIWVEDMPVFDDNQSMQTAITKMVGSIDWSSLGITDLEGAKQYIQQTIFNPISKALDSPDDKLEVTNALSKLFTLDLSKMPVEEAKKAIDGFLTTIMNILNQGVPDAEKKTLDDMYKMFGFGDVENLQKQYDNAITKTKDKFKSEPIDITPYQEALDDEYQKIQDWGLEDYADKIKNGTIQSVFGNVDMDKRTIITWSDELKQTYADALASWDYNPEVGSIDTVFGGSNRFGEELNGVGWEVAFTPILPDGTFLSQDAVYDYINTILEEAYANDGKVTEDELVDIDAQGRQIGNTFVHGIFAGIDDSQNYDNNGNWAETVGRLMHFSGDFGAVQIAKDAIEKAKKQESDFDWDSWFKENSINTQEEIDRWNEIAESTTNAADARKKYTEGEEGNKTDSSSPLSFADAWENLKSVGDDKKDVTPELLNLAKSGELSDKILETTTEYNTLLTDTGMSAKEARLQIMKMITEQEKLSGFKTQMDNIANAYNEFREKKFVTAETLESIPDVFKDMNDGKDFDIFSKIVGDPKSGKKKIKEAFNQLITEYVKDQNLLDGVTEKDKNAVIANLEDVGVTNAREVVNSYVKSEEQIENVKKEFEGKEHESRVADIKNFQNALKDKNTSFVDACNTLGGNNAKLINSLGEQYKDDYVNWLDLLDKKKEAYNDFVDAWNEANSKVQQDPKNAYGYYSTVKEKKNQAKKAEEEANAKEKKIEEYNKLNLNFNPLEYNPKETGDPTSPSENKDKSSSTKQVFDWLERRITVLNNKLNLLKAKLENTFSVKSKNSIIDQEIKKTNALIATYKKQASVYKAKAKASAKAKTNDKSKLSKNLQKKIQNGQVKGTRKQLIKKYGGKTANAIQEYQDYWDKYQEARTNIQTARKTRRDYKIEKYQNYVDAKDALISKYDAKIDESKSASGKNSIINQKIAATKDSYHYQIKIAQLEHDSVKEAQLRAERETAVRDLLIEQQQNLQDEADSYKDMYEAQKENATSAKEKNGYLQKEQGYIVKSYNAQIQVAKLEGNVAKQKQLEAEKAKALLDNKNEQLQNLSDEVSAQYDLNQQLETNADTAKDKNAYESSSRRNLKDQYAYQIQIAKNNKDVTEQKRLQAELEQKIEESYQKEIENIKEEYDLIIGLNEARSSTIGSKISALQANGFGISTDLYAEQQNVALANYAEKLKEIADVESKMQSLSGDALEKAQQELEGLKQDAWGYQQAWAEAQNSINEINLAKLERTSTLLEYQASELEYIQDILGHNEFTFSEDGIGGLTTEGLANAAVTFGQMANNNEQLINKTKELAEIQRQIANGEYVGTGDDAQEKINSLNEEIRELTTSNYEFGESIKSLVEDCLSSLTEALDESISKYKEALQTQKDLYEYRKKIADQLKSISSLEKQLAALQGDDSEEARARIQKLQVSLEDEQENLKDMEYDKYIQDQEEMLDKLSDDWQDFVASVTDMSVSEICAAMSNAVTDNLSEISTAITDAFNESSKIGDIASSVQGLNDTLSGLDFTTKVSVNGVESGASSFEYTDNDGQHVKIATDEYGTITEMFVNGVKVEIPKKSVERTDKDIVDAETNGAIKGQMEAALEKLRSTNENKATTTTTSTNSKTSSNNKTTGAYKFVNGAISGHALDGKISYDDIGQSGTLKKDATYYKYALAGGIKKGDKGKKTKSAHKVKIKAIDNNGNIQISSANKRLNNAWIPKSKSKYLTGFSTGGVIGDLKEIVKANGDDSLAINSFKKGEAILTPVQTEMFKQLVDNLSPLNTAIESITTMPKYPSMAKTVDSSVNIGNVNVEAHLDGSNVVDADTFIKTIHEPRVLKEISNGVSSQLSTKMSNRLSNF